MKTCASPWPETLGEALEGPIEGIRFCRKHSRGKRNAVSLFLPPQGDLAGISPTPNQPKMGVWEPEREGLGGLCTPEGGDGPVGATGMGGELPMVSGASQGLEGSPKTLSSHLQSWAEEPGITPSSSH